MFSNSVRFSYNISFALLVQGCSHDFKRVYIPQVPVKKTAIIVTAAPVALAMTITAKLKILLLAMMSKSTDWEFWWRWRRRRFRRTLNKNSEVFFILSWSLFIFIFILSLFYVLFQSLKKVTVIVNTLVDSAACNFAMVPSAALKSMLKIVNNVILL